MKPALAKIAAAKTYELDDLIRGVEAWKDATETERLDFHHSRLALLKRFGCAYYDSSRLLETSGSSCGIRKKYRWGPCFERQFEFFDWLKFGWFEPYDWIIYVKLNPESPTVWASSDHTSPRYKLMALGTGRVAEQSEEAWRLATDFGSRKIVLYLMPTYARLMIARGFRFDLFDPAKTVIYTTGEAAPPEIGEHFRKLGFHYVDGMRVWTGGATFVTCRHGNKHWIDFLSHNTVEGGELHSTDYFNLAQTFYKFSTGDIIETSRRDQCRCGLPVDEINFTQQKVSTIDIGAETLSYQDLSTGLRKALVRVAKAELLCCSFGFDGDQIVIHYETVHPQAVDPGELAAAFCDYTAMAGKKIKVVPHGKYGKYKAARLFRVGDGWSTSVNSQRPLKLF